MQFAERQRCRLFLPDRPDRDRADCELVTRPTSRRAEVAVRPGQVEVPVKLLADRVDQNRILSVGKVVDAFRPKRNREADEQHGVDQDDGKFQVGRDPACDAFVVGHRDCGFCENGSET